MNYLKLRDGRDPLYLVEQPIPQTAPLTPVREPRHHVWIFDRSGSMYSVLSRLCDDIIARAQTLPAGDFLSLGWFSSEGGEFDIFLRGFKITGTADSKTVTDIVNKQRHTVGLTCFSEVLEETEKLVQTLMGICPNFAFMFLSDGCPVVSNRTKEIATIHRVCKTLGARVNSSLLVGYGDWYNKQLMAEMATALGGTLVHADDLKAFNGSFGAFIENAPSVPKVSVPLQAVAYKNVIFTIQGTQVAALQEDGKGVVMVAPSAPSEAVYVLTDMLPVGGTEQKLGFVQLTDPGNTLARAVYAAGIALIQKGENVDAIEVLGATGDKAVVDKASNAFTNAEYGAAEERAAQAMNSVTSRFQEGHQAGYVPAADAFCLVGDVLPMLMADPEAKFYPYHEAFAYKRIGVPSQTKPGYPKFAADKKSGVPVSQLSWNQTKLNLSLLAQIHGTVALENSSAAELKKAGLRKQFPSKVWRNYTLVRDGVLNVTRLPVSTTEETFDRLQAAGMVEATERWVADKPYVVELAAAPVINRALAAGKTSATDLCEKVARDLQLGAALKVWKSLREELDPEKKLVVTAFNSDQLAVLEANGINQKGEFSPPTEKGTPTDKYVAKEFEVKAAGWSSLPKLADVRAKVAAKKALNAPGMAMADCLREWETVEPTLSSLTAKLSWLDNRITQDKAQQARVRNDVQKTKFAVVLGRHKFAEFANSREDSNSLTLPTTPYGAMEFTVSVRTVEVPV